LACGGAVTVVAPARRRTRGGGDCAGDAVLRARLGALAEAVGALTAQRASGRSRTAATRTAAVAGARLPGLRSADASSVAQAAGQRALGGGLAYRAAVAAKAVLPRAPVRVRRARLERRVVAGAGADGTAVGRDA